MGREPQRGVRRQPGASPRDCQPPSAGSPERAYEAPAAKGDGGSCALSGLEGIWVGARVPRALPWAVVGRPVGAGVGSMKIRCLAPNFHELDSSSSVGGLCDHERAPEARQKIGPGVSPGFTAPGAQAPAGRQSRGVRSDSQDSAAPSGADPRASHYPQLTLWAIL
jgi:hypothetical protein